MTDTGFIEQIEHSIKDMKRRRKRILKMFPERSMPPGIQKEIDVHNEVIRDLKGIKREAYRVLR